MLDRLKSLLQDPPPAMAFEISEAGIAAARITSRAELDFQAFRPGTVQVSPLQENVNDPDEFVMTVRSLSATQAARKKKDVALILPDYSARITVLDFDQFPSDVKEQAGAWPPGGDNTNVLRAIKRAFDPAGVLNAGRGYI